MCQCYALTIIPVTRGGTRIQIIEELPTMEVLAKYLEIPISYSVDSIFRPLKSSDHSNEWVLQEEPIAKSYLKDYDLIDDPKAWFTQFDASKWAVFSAFDGSTRAGGAILAWNTPGVNMLEGRSDLVVLWDIRIHPNYRRQSIGSQLFANAIEWGKEKGCRELKVETQDINVRACKFYEKMGCVLRVVKSGAYPELPDETQFLWYREL